MEITVCPICKGKGKIDEYTDWGSAIKVTCPMCKGNTNYRTLKYRNPTTRKIEYADYTIDEEIKND